MLKNYFKLALRNLYRHLGFSLINLFGLALGIASAFVILLYVWQESTYDQHFEDHDRIYRVATDFFDMGGFAKSQEQLLAYLPAETPGIEQVTRVDRGFQSIEVTLENQTYQEPHYFYVDSTFFDMFSYRFQARSAQTVLRTPDDVVLTEALAKKYFGDESALGKVILIDEEKRPYRVSGVVENPTGRTHFHAAFFLPLMDRHEEKAVWTNVTYYNYVKLRPGSSKLDLEEGLERVLRNHAYTAAKSDLSYEQWRRTPQAVQFWVQPLTDIYLHSDFQFEISAGGNPMQVYIMGIIGLFILLIAGVNYINLTTARSATRAKEVGMRKTLGAVRSMLIGQFLAETVVFSLLAMAVALGLAEIMLVVFEGITGTILVESFYTNVWHIVALFGMSVSIGLVAGLYPAFYLSSFRPTKILKRDWSGSGNRHLRSALVVLQFTIATTLIICSLIVYKQLVFMQETDKGFVHEGVLVIENMRALDNQAEVFRQQLEQQPQVIETSFAGRIPTGSGIWMYTYQTPEMEESKTIQTFPADDHFITTLGMRLLAGRNFSRELASDSTAAILNEAAVAALNLGDAPLGKTINEDQTVVGVVSDFNFQSLRETIAPVVLTYAPFGGNLAVKVQGRGLDEVTAQVQTLWEQYTPEDPIRYSFLDDNFAQMAAKENMLGKAVSFFTVLGLLIACLGLFALSAFTAERRTKEIGVRKVFGATVTNIVGLLSKDFLKLVLIAFSLAAPLAYLAMHRWLEDFAYHVSMGWYEFLLTGLVVLLIACLTVSYQSIKTARANPVDSLRYE